VEEPTVAAARPGAARLGLEQDDIGGRAALAQRQRSPEPGEAAADDADVGRGVALERWGRLLGARLVQPPGREPGLDR
jgi:hypothetical protein